MKHWACLAMLLAACDVYSADLLDAGGNDASGGCPRGLADCDGNGTCESDLASNNTCGTCSNTCVAGETCVASTICLSGDVRDIDVGIPDTGPDANIRDTGTDDTGTDANVTPDAGVEACALRPPARPSIPDMADMPNVQWALRDIVINQGGGVWEGIGYDLDGQCTDMLGDDFLCTPPDADFPPFDGPGGVDNTFGDKILSLLNTYDPSFQSTVRGVMNTGLTAMIILKDWNHTDNDPMVDVNLVRTLGTVGGGMPLWDGTDVLIPSSDSYNPATGDALLRDEGAYVVDGTLVAHFPDRQPLIIPWLDETQFRVRITDSVLTARISADRRTLTNLMFQGRFARVDLENSLMEVGFCPGGTARGFIDIELNNSVDIRAFPGGASGGTCDAISMAFRYTGTQVASPTTEPQTPPLPEPVPCLP